MCITYITNIAITVITITNITIVHQMGAHRTQASRDPSGEHVSGGSTEGLPAPALNQGLLSAACCLLPAVCCLLSAVAMHAACTETSRAGISTVLSHTQEMLHQIESTSSRTQAREPADHTELHVNSCPDPTNLLHVLLVLCLTRYLLYTVAESRCGHCRADKSLPGPTPAPRLPPLLLSRVPCALSLLLDSPMRADTNDSLTASIGDFARCGLIQERATAPVQAFSPGLSLRLRRLVPSLFWLLESHLFCFFDPPARTYSLMCRSGIESSRS
jgi:hypothetical protein